MAFYSYLSTKIIIAFITKSYQDLFGVRSYINAIIICIGDRILERIIAETKTPFPVAVNAVEVDSRHSGRRHVRHIQAAGNGIANFDPRSITVEINGESGRMP